MSGRLSTSGPGNLPVKLELRQGNGRWAVIAKVETLDSGAFSYRLKLKHAGSYQLRATFAGDRLHVPAGVLSPFTVG